FPPPRAPPRAPAWGSPSEPLVEPVEHEPLQPLVAARALRPELVEASIAPDHAAREQHRTARPRPLLQHERCRAQLARPRSGAEPGQARAEYPHAFPVPAHS